MLTLNIHEFIFHSTLVSFMCILASISILSTVGCLVRRKICSLPSQKSPRIVPKPFLYCFQSRLKLVRPILRLWMTVQPPPLFSMSQNTWRNQKHMGIHDKSSFKLNTLLVWRLHEDSDLHLVQVFQGSHLLVVYTLQKFCSSCCIGMHNHRLHLREREFLV